MIDSLPAAITAISSSLTILRAAVGVRDENKMLLALNDVYADVMTAQTQAVTALSQLTAKDAKIRELEETINRMRDWSAERENYELKQIGHSVFAQVPKHLAGKYQDALKFCANCFESGRKSLLQNRVANTGRNVHLVCPNGCPELVFHYFLEPPAAST